MPQENGHYGAQHGAILKYRQTETVTQWLIYNISSMVGMKIFNKTLMKISEIGELFCH
jgi:hypothetical protein